MKIGDYPLVKFIAYFIGGIIFAEVSRLDFNVFVFSLALSFTFFLFFFFVKKYLPANFFALLSIVLLGASYNSFALVKTASIRFPFSENYRKNTVLYGSVENIDVPRKEALTFILVCDSARTKNGEKAGRFTALVKFKGNSEDIGKLAKILLPGYYVKLEASLIRPKGKRNPGEFDYAYYLKEKEISALATISKLSALSVLEDSAENFSAIIYKMRLALNSAINSLYSVQSRPLVKALILGERRDLNRDVVTDFINTGTVHVLAVSGLHVGFIAAIFLLIFGRFGIYIRAVFTVLGLIIFVLISGAHPSVIRATVMAVTLIVAFLSGRDYNPVNALSFAALLLLVYNPRELFNPGFQLSFSAVLSILAFYPYFSTYIKRNLNGKLIRGILLFVAVSFSAQIGTLPFTLVYFHKLSLISLAANLFIVPLIGIILSLSVTSLILLPISHYLASLYALVNSLAIDILFLIAEFISQLKFSYLDIYDFSLSNALLYYSLLFLLIYAFGHFRKTAKIAVLELVLLNYAIYSELLSPEIFPQGQLSVVAIDVGQGDAFLVRFPNNEAVLIDAGNATSRFDNGSRVISPLLKYFGIDTLKALFVSHVDADHYRGSFSIVKSGVVRTVYKPRLDKNIPKDVRFENFLNKHNCNIFYYQRNALNIGGCRLYILNDTTASAYLSFDMNNRSGLLKIVYGNVSVLFTGDLEKEGESFYVASYDGFLESNVLKAGHHGSKSSTSEKFLQAVQPQYAIISAGAGNKFGHPDLEVLKRLNKFGVEIKRTDTQGAVIFSTDGKNIKFIDWK